MAKIYYRLTDTPDPEERLEDAAMWKAMHDEYGDEITLLGDNEAPEEGGTTFGRGKRFETTAFKNPVPEHLPYWEDPAFLSRAGRHFELCDIHGAQSAVETLHAMGKDAFLKATALKLMVMKIPVGTGFDEALDAWAYSFIDRPPCLMVQEFIDMAFERRFVAIEREIVTHSPIAVHLTPLDHLTGFAHYLTPREKRPFIQSPSITEQMYGVACEIAAEMRYPHAIIDLAMSGERVVTVEFNPCRIGHFGLYACDPWSIARASRALIDRKEQAQ